MLENLPFHPHQKADPEGKPCLASSLLFCAKARIRIHPTLKV